MKLRSLYESVCIAGSVRSLSLREGMHDALGETLRDFATLTLGKDRWVLCGGLAVGFRAEPRGTSDIDVLVQDEAAVLSLARVLGSKFKNTRLHGFLHRTTGVEVELLTPSFLNLDPLIVRMTLADATLESFLRGVEVPVASATSLIALKLTRANRRDLADIEAIVKRNGPLDLSAYPLNDKQKQTYEEILKDPPTELKEDPI